MTVLGTLRSRFSRRGDVSFRLAGLEAALVAARGRVDPLVLEEGEQVLARAQARMRLSAEHTVVALAGATGSGKSSLFNRLCGLELAAVGVRRPTTSWALACAWGEGAEEMLEWLGIPPRHQVNRASVLDVAEPERHLHGLVLLDLPDHDSTEVAHHLEVERLVALADVIVWVLDPQKYADAAIHDRYLRPLASHREVMLAVFNHIDELSPEAATQAVADARKLLAADGLGDLTVIPTSSTRGDGLADLRAEIAKRVDEKRSSRARVAADIEAVAQRLHERTGSAEPISLSGKGRDDLVDACADAAGVPVVVEALQESLQMRARQATGWPPTRWISRLRADPLTRLHLVRRNKAETSDAGAVARSSLPPASPVQRARVATAVRRAADLVAEGLPPAWQAATRSASIANLPDLTDALDRAVGKTEVEVGRMPRWWSAVRALQWVLLAIALLGALWLAALVAFSYLALSPPSGPRWLSIPVPTWLLVGGLAVGLAVASVARAAGNVSARRRARRADLRLRSSVADVVDELVVRPVGAEMEAFRACRAGLAAALTH